MRPSLVLFLSVIVYAGQFSGFVQAETLLERGTYLMKGIVACGNCHTPKGPKGEIKEMEFAGGFKWDEKPFTAYASNITPDIETGIGSWTDDQIIKAIRGRYQT